MHELEFNQPLGIASVSSDAQSLGSMPEQVAVIDKRMATREDGTVAGSEGAVDGDVEAVMRRVRAVHARRQRGESREVAPSSAEIVSRMREGGYPQRALDRVDSMFGPSLEKAKELLSLILDGDTILLLHGDRGPGKTQMATWWAFQRGLRSLPVGRYVKTFDLLGMIKESWESKRASESGIIRAFKKTPFLVLDEFQERSESDWDNRTLTNILDHRYDARLVTILIANLKREELKERVPASILSRAEEVGGRVFCNWASYRSGG